MTFEDQVKYLYFKWLYDCVCKSRVHDEISYDKIFMYLHGTEFTFSIDNDINRAVDGIDLRYRFSQMMEDDRMMDILEGPCSMLEMMVALSIRCEETLMSDPKYGDRTSQWFWKMMSSLGISHCTDDNFNIRYVNEQICNFLDHKYTSDGKGGLFYVRGYQYDLRDMEIWSQLCCFLNSFA